MKKSLLLLSLCFLFSISCLGQYAQRVRAAASGMLKAKNQKDYETYVSYFYPTELKFRGGKAKLIQLMKKNDKDLVLLNLKVKTVNEHLGKVSKFYKAGKELHCTIEWIYTLKSPEGRSKSNGHFLGISGDQGKSWKFIVTSGKTPSEVWAMVPKFNEDLTWVDWNE